MSQRTDQEYLRKNQYFDASKLQARINLHHRFSTNRANWFRWVFDHFIALTNARILEIGCGSGMLWAQNLDRLPRDWQIHISDFSPGMLLEANRNVQDCVNPFSKVVSDAQAIPYPSECFDLVIANHMLYHILDRPKALSEIFRILKPSAYLIAATNGRHHMSEIRDILALIYPGLADKADYSFGVSEFTIENGSEQLAPWFSNIQTILFFDSLEVTDIEPLMAYILSMGAIPKTYMHNIDILTKHLKTELTIHGSIHITKSTALFVAEKKLTS